MTTEQALVELRSLPGAPETLRERVLALPEPNARIWTLPRLEIRRLVLVAGTAVLAISVGAAALNGVVAGGSGDNVSSGALAQRDQAPTAWERATTTTPAQGGTYGAGASSAPVPGATATDALRAVGA